MFDTVDVWISWGALLFGFIFILISVATFYQSRRRRRSWWPRTGTIINSQLADGLTRFQVAFENDGRQVQFWNRYTSSRAGLDAVGRTVDLLVNPDDPADAVIVKGAVRPTTVAWAFLAFGILATIVGVYALTR